MYNDDTICCRGKNCSNTTETEEAYVELRSDSYGIPTGYYCEDCYETNYPYRRDNYYDWLNAGEYLESDY